MMTFTRAVAPVGLRRERSYFQRGKTVDATSWN
jgi:hypothetical protein